MLALGNRGTYSEPRPFNPGKLPLAGQGEDAQGISLEQEGVSFGGVAARSGIAA